MNTDRFRDFYKFIHNICQNKDVPLRLLDSEAHDINFHIMLPVDQIKETKSHILQLPGSSQSHLELAIEMSNS